MRTDLLAHLLQVLGLHHKQDGLQRLQLGGEFLLSELVNLTNLAGNLLDLLDDLSFGLLNVDMVSREGREVVVLRVLPLLPVDFPVDVSAVADAGLTLAMRELVGEIMTGPD